jgi:hypothetical protein
MTIAIRTVVLVSILGSALGACGDNLARPDAEIPIDASAGPPRAVVVAGDFVDGHPGVLTTLDPATGMVKVNVGPALAVGADPMLRHFGGELFIVNRSQNNITILDDQTLALKEQLGTGPGTNPQDVAVVGNKLYVPTFATRGVTVLTRGSTTVTEIDLSADDPDGTPNCNSIYLVGDKLYVSCELLDGDFAPRGPGKVYVLESATGAVQPGPTVTLSRKNPFGLFEQIPASAPHGGDLLITTVEDFSTTGCIERVTPGAAPAAAGCVLENAMIGGYATRVGFEVNPGLTMMWAAVAVLPFDLRKAELRGYDLTTNSLWEAPINPATQFIADLAHCPSGEVVVFDATPAANGLRVYVNAVEKTTAAIPIGLGSFSQHGLVCY